MPDLADGETTESISFRYQELSNDGVPRLSSYVRVRDDATW